MIELDRPETLTNEQIKRVKELRDEDPQIRIARIRANDTKYIDAAKNACDTTLTGVCPACGSDLILPDTPASVNLLRNFSCLECGAIVRTRMTEKNVIWYVDWMDFGVSVHDGKAYNAKWEVVF